MCHDLWTPRPGFLVSELAKMKGEQQSPVACRYTSTVGRTSNVRTSVPACFCPAGLGHTVYEWPGRQLARWKHMLTGITNSGATVISVCFIHMWLQQFDPGMFPGETPPGKRQLLPLEICCRPQFLETVIYFAVTIRNLRIVFLRSNRISNRIGRPIRFRIEFSNRIGRIYHASRNTV